MILVVYFPLYMYGPSSDSIAAGHDTLALFAVTLTKSDTIKKILFFHSLTIFAAKVIV